MIAVIRSWPTFILIWAGQFVSALGSGLTGFALDVWVFQRTGSITQFAIATLFFVLPRVLIAPLAGVAVDRWNRRTVMLLADSTAAFCTLLIVVLLWIDQLAVWHIYLCNVVISMSSAFQGPAWSAAIGSLIPADQLSRANGLRQLSRAAVSLLAPVLAGFLIGQIGLCGIALIDLLTFGIAVLALLIVRFPVMVGAADKGESPRWLSEAIEGWRYLRHNQGWAGLMLMYCFTSFFGITTEVLLSPYVLTTGSSIELGWVVSATGAGLLVGGVVMSVWRNTRRLVSCILIFEMIVSVITVLIGLWVSPVVLAGFMFIYFVCIAISDGSSETFWQRSVSPQYQGRIFSMRDMIASAAFPLGLLIVAPLAEFVLEPVMQNPLGWAGVVGSIFGTGPGRGIACVFVLTGLFNIITVGVFAKWLPIRAMEAPPATPELE